MPRTFSIGITGLIGLYFLVFSGIAMAASDPHSGTGYENVSCNSCHMLHNALGSSLTNNASNPNLCMSCHVSGGSATNWPFSSGDQATPGVSGTSHRWDGDMTPNVGPLNLVAGNANNKYGLRTAGELTIPALKTYMQVFSNVVTCSVCHQQHNQSNTPYDAFSYNSSGGDGGGAATGGSLNTLSDTTKTSWTAPHQWATYTLVIPGSVNASSIGAVKTISTSTTDTLTVSSNFSVAIQAGDTYYITKTGSTSDYGTATGGSTTSVVAGKAWAVNQWAGYYVKMTSGANVGLRRRIGSNDPTTLTIPAAEAFPSPVANTDKFYITSSRHLMRISNALNELCVDCHYYRTPGSKPGGTISQTDVRTWDNNKKSHPIGKKLSEVSDPAQFNASFLEPQAAGWAQQGGTRYQSNGTGDSNLTNNITVGIDGKITCLSCHNIHYSDSNASTVDTPSGYAP